MSGPSGPGPNVVPNSPSPIVCRRGLLSFDRPGVMGILNVTPDSFSDGGAYATLETALAHARQMVSEGADIIDVGGESTRPGAAAVGVQQEIDRVVPVIEALAATSDTLISIDSSKPAVLRAAAAAGADLINDVRALREPGALEAAAELQLPVCLMHMQGTPGTMQRSPAYTVVLEEVESFLCSRIEACVAAGLARSRLLIDPGFGFGKTLTHNLALLRGLSKLAMHAPVVAGLSRKRMIGALVADTDRQDVGADADARLIGSVAAGMLCVQRGAHLLRVHDVAPTVQALAVLQAVDFAPDAGETLERG